MSEFARLSTLMLEKMGGQDHVDKKVKGEVWEFDVSGRLISVNHVSKGGSEFFGLPSDEMWEANLGGARYSVHKPLSDEMKKLSAIEFDVLPGQDGYEKGIVFLTKALALLN